MTPKKRPKSMAKAAAKPFATKRPDKLPSSVANVSREGLHELFGQSGDKRLSAANPEFIYPVGPPTVADQFEWPVNDFNNLKSADESNHLGNHTVAYRNVKYILSLE